MACSLSRVEAWVPRPEITDAAIAALPKTYARMIEMLGDRNTRVARYLVWMGDFGNQSYKLETKLERQPTEPPSVEFYANDFPRLSPVAAFTRGPEKNVHAVLPPCKHLKPKLPPMRRAGWENVLHFQTDEGALPHAADLTGEIHVRMESWVVADEITIADMSRSCWDTPTRLSRVSSAASSRTGRLQHKTGKRVYSLIMAGDQRQPIILESQTKLRASPRTCSTPCFSFRAQA